MASRQGWEQADFPILCETCLGPNPYIRMQKEHYGKECKICNRPYTVFKWNQESGKRFKLTEICQTCSKIKNVCQSCVLDLEFSLPVGVRDSVLEIDTIPNSDVNRQYFVNSMDGKLKDNESYVHQVRAGSKAKELLRKVARAAADPYGDRAATASASDGDSSIAEKIANMPDSSMPASLKPPADQSITSLFLNGVDEEITEPDLRNHFYAFGDIKSIQILYKSRCAFINYFSRISAEAAVSANYSTLLNIKGKNLKLQWGKPKARKGVPAKKAGSTAAVGVNSSEIGSIDHLLSLPAPPPPPGVGPGVYYPSADPTSLGSSLGAKVKE